GAVLPGLDRIGAEPAPDRGARDRGGDALLDGGAGQIGALPASQRLGLVGLRWEFAGQRLDGDHHVRGGNSGAVLPEADRSVGPDAGRRSVCAIWRRLAAACLGVRRSRRCPGLRPRRARSGPAQLPNTMTYIDARASSSVRSASAKAMLYGLVRGMLPPSSREPSHVTVW